MIHMVIVYHNAIPSYPVTDYLSSIVTHETLAVCRESLKVLWGMFD